MEQLFSWRGDSDEGAARDEGEARTKSIVVFAVGSRGDVQPSCVLALALQASGHEVHVATEERLKPLVDEFKLRWRRLEGDKVGVLHEPEAQDALRQGSFFKLMQLTKRWEARFDKQRILASFVEASEAAARSVRQPDSRPDLANV
ncbi:hypothetical protein T492DRAFT_831241 [Pavlovales sp. CCMP2436]|nr:hypothetical protein T492DRAFT_831241 [Pavlovales sp. CCMP2436]